MIHHMTLAHRPLPPEAQGSPAGARRRLLELRRQLREPGRQVDVDAVAAAITRRAVFATRLRRWLSRP